MFARSMTLRTSDAFIKLNRFNKPCCNVAGQLAWRLSSSRHNLRLDHDDCAKRSYESIERLGWIELLVAVDYSQKLVTEVRSGGGQYKRLLRHFTLSEWLKNNVEGSRFHLDPALVQRLSCGARQTYRLASKNLTGDD